MALYLFLNIKHIGYLKSLKPNILGDEETFSSPFLSLIEFTRLCTNKNDKNNLVQKYVCLNN